MININPLNTLYYNLGKTRTKPLYEVLSQKGSYVEGN